MRIRSRPHSTTLRDVLCTLRHPPGFGLRLPSGSLDYRLDPSVFLARLFLLLISPPKPNRDRCGPGPLPMSPRTTVDGLRLALGVGLGTTSGKTEVRLSNSPLIQTNTKLALVPNLANFPVPLRLRGRGDVAQTRF